MLKKIATLRSQARKMVYDVYCYMELESTSVNETVKRTAGATRISERTVRRIASEGKNLGFHQTLQRKGKKKKTVTEVANFDKYKIRMCVHNYNISNKELPTIIKLREKLAKDMNFNGSITSLRRILHNLGFRWKKAENNRKLLIEKSNSRLLRIEYLEKLIRYRREGRTIVYIHESYIDVTNSGSKTASDVSQKGPIKRSKIWSDESCKMVKVQVPKLQRIVVLLAATEEGFVPNAQHLYKVTAEPGGVYIDMNYEDYKKWICSKVMPNLTPNSILVVADASYHTKQCDHVPTSYSKKAEIHQWLTEKGIQFDNNMFKPQLYNLIKKYQMQLKKPCIDDILAEENHSVLRLPTNHADLNPMEMVNAQINMYCQNLALNGENVIELLEKELSFIEAGQWTTMCEKVRKLEADYIKSDKVVDLVTDQYNVYAVDSSDSSDSGSDESEIEDEMDETPTASTSSPNFVSELLPIVTILGDSDDDM